MTSIEEWENQFISGESERDELIDMVRWAYSKLHSYSFSKQEDALMLDQMKLYFEVTPNDKVSGGGAFPPSA